jgi:hypothetical protein
MLDSFGPSVKWCTPIAARLNSNIVYTSDYSEESIFSPMRSPRISYIPVLNAVFFAPTNNSYLVRCVKISSCVVVDSTDIVVK